MEHWRPRYVSMFYPATPPERLAEGADCVPLCDDHVSQVKENQNRYFGTLRRVAKLLHRNLRWNQER